jgi:hypothetical protein
MTVRYGYPWVPTDQAHGRPRQVGPAYQKTRRPVSGPNRPSWRPTRPPEDLPEDPPRRPNPSRPQDFAYNTKTSVDFNRSRSTGYGKMCNVDLGLLVVTDQESGNRPHPLANIRWMRRPLVTFDQSSSNLHRQLDVGYYSPEARTSINSLCSLCSAYSCATFEFLALDSSSPNN